VLKGDMNYAHATRVPKYKIKWYKLDKITRDAYEIAAQKSQDKDFQAMMYHKIGKVYDELSDNKEKAKEYWQKAVSTAPDSEAAQLAGEKLASLHP
jgi:predicted negative regulator of RcsB-dependent stress response